MILIVGLGNPGAKYEKTYHNIGFLVLDKIAQELGEKFGKKAGNALVCETKIDGQKVIFAKPQTYMNLSGESVLQLKNKFKIENENMLIILDDIDLPKGDTRFRTSGSAGTHNGLRNIVSLLGDNNVPRFRIGIGKDERMDLADYVLSSIKKEDEQIFDDAIEKAKNFVLKEFIANKNRQK